MASRGCFPHDVLLSLRYFAFLCALRGSLGENELDKQLVHHLALDIGESEIST